MLIGTLNLSTVATATNFTVSEPIERLAYYRATLTDVDGTVASADFLGDEFLDLPGLAAAPTDDDGALTLDMARRGTLTSSANVILRMWPSSTTETIFYVQKSRTDSLTLRIYKINYAYTTQNRQRVEGVVFNAVPSTTTELQIQTISSDGVVIEFGTGAVEMLTAVPGANTFMIARAGVYMMEWVAVITPNEARPEPCLQILNNADNTLLGQIDPTYIRFTAAGTYHVRRAGPVIIPEDNMVVRALVENCRSDNAFSVAGGHQLNFIRGALGARGADGTGGGGGGSGDDAFDWATVGDTSLVPDAKLPVGILTGIDTFSYIAASRAIVLNFDRIDGSTNNGQIILPDFLDATEVYDWALASNADRLPNSKLGLDVVIGITSVTYDTSTRNLRVRLPQADGGDTSRRQRSRSFWRLRMLRTGQRPATPTTSRTPSCRAR